MTIIDAHTPWHHPIGGGLMLVVQRSYQPLLGVGFDHDEWRGWHQAVVGIGLHWLFVTVAVTWWTR